MSNTSTTTARKPRTRKAVVAEVVLDDVLDSIDLEAGVDDTEEVAAPNRKYMTHAACGHATKGDAGKAARAMCRRNVRAWLAAEIEHLASIAA